MAQVTVTPAQVAVLYPQKAIIYDRIAAVALEVGQVAVLNTAGRAVLGAAGTAPGTKNPGLVLTKAGPGQACSVLKEGHVAGFNVSALNVGASVFVSDTAGQLGDAAGTVSTLIGSVDAVAEAGGPVKVVYIEADWS